MGSPAPFAPAAAAPAVRHRLRRRRRAASAPIRPVPAPVAQIPALLENWRSGMTGKRNSRDKEARQRPRLPQAPPAWGSSRRTASRPSPATRRLHMEETPQGIRYDKPMRRITVRAAPAGCTPWCGGAPLTPDASSVAVETAHVGSVKPRVSHMWSFTSISSYVHNI